MKDVLSALGEVVLRVSGEDWQVVVVGDVRSVGCLCLGSNVSWLIFPAEGAPPRDVDIDTTITGTHKYKTKCRKEAW